MAGVITTVVPITQGGITIVANTMMADTIIAGVITTAGATRIMTCGTTTITIIVDEVGPLFSRRREWRRPSRVQSARLVAASFTYGMLGGRGFDRTP
jgi:hypothetical protein